MLKVCKKSDKRICTWAKGGIRMDTKFSIEFPIGIRLRKDFRESKYKRSKRF